MKNSILKPSKELLKLEKEKVKLFKPNKSNSMQSIRLTSDDQSYTLFYQMGMTYIGSWTKDNLGNFFKNKDVYELRDNLTMKVNAKMQRL